MKTNKDPNNRTKSIVMGDPVCRLLLIAARIWMNTCGVLTSLSVWEYFIPLYEGPIVTTGFVTVAWSWGCWVLINATLYTRFLSIEKNHP